MANNTDTQSDNDLRFALNNDFAEAMAVRDSCARCIARRLLNDDPHNEIPALLRRFEIADESVRMHRIMS